MKIILTLILEKCKLISEMQMCNVYAHLYFCYCFVAVYRTTLFEKGEEIEIRSKNKKNRMFRNITQKNWGAG